MYIGFLKDLYHCKPPVAIMAPNFSKRVSKFWKLVSERKYALTSRKYALTSRKYALTARQIFTNFLKRFEKNIVTRFLKNFRIYGTPPSPGVYNDTNSKNVAFYLLRDSESLKANDSSTKLR